MRKGKGGVSPELGSGEIMARPMSVNWYYSAFIEEDAFSQAVDELMGQLLGRGYELFWPDRPFVDVWISDGSNHPFSDLASAKTLLKDGGYIPLFRPDNWHAGIGVEKSPAPPYPTLAITAEGHFHRGRTEGNERLARDAYECWLGFCQRHKVIYGYVTDEITLETPWTPLHRVHDAIRQGRAPEDLFWINYISERLRKPENGLRNPSPRVKGLGTKVERLDGASLITVGDPPWSGTGPMS